MKGFVNEFGIAIAPCGSCKYKDKMLDEKPCCDCMSGSDLALRKPVDKIEYSNYEGGATNE